jgi:hypothetical protein
MAGSSTVFESDKRLLTEYFINRIRTRLSGRDGLDIVDATPIRSLFAGVMQPVRVDQAGDAPSGTAIGLDFRVRPSEGRQSIDISIEAGWSHYYIVYPTFAASRRANGQILGADSLSAPGMQPAPGSASVLTGDGPSSTEETQNSSESVDTEASPEDGEDQEDRVSVGAGTVVLPRTWRRKDARPPAIRLTIPLSDGQFEDIGSAVYSEAISNLSLEMTDDPDRWRHFGDPEQRQRALGTAKVLNDQAAYSAALQAVKGDPAPLPDWSTSLRLETRIETSDPSLLRVRVLLANTTRAFDPSIQDSGLQERALFDAKLRVTVHGGDLVPFDFLLAPKDYKSNPQMIAKGINCVASLDPAEAATLTTESLPVFKQPLYRTRDTLQIPFTALDVSDPIPELDQVADAMASYLTEWDVFLQTEALAALPASGVEACRRERDEFEREMGRFRLGVEALRDNSRLLAAFRLMNRAFARLGTKSGGRITSWRLFQIGFIVSQMPALAVREIPSSRNDTFAATLRSMLQEVGILWFPTGGGKTEAYLGLIACAVLFDRLRGKLLGITAWMRFPLRMLSLQQLQRLGRVIAVLNELRAENPEIAVGDPFAMGYYVGDGNTPNRISEDEMRNLEQKPALREDLKLLRKCPHCGEAVTVETRRADWRLAHKCNNDQCFSNTSASLSTFRGSLPLFIVDNEIYRYLPSVLVGTVDKLAIVGRSRYFSHLVRGARQRCSKHGYTSYDECIEKFAGCAAKKRELQKVPQIKDPGPSLLIQDELHLLRAELGVFNGHYEGLLNYLGDKVHMAPKVLAATATIEAYDTHAFHVYLSRSRRFPQPAWRSGESFYATSSPPTSRRFYLGILGHTRGIEEPALRALAVYLEEVRRLKATPQRVLDLMNRGDLTEDDAKAVLRLYDLELCYVNRKATGGSIIDKLGQVERNLLLDNLGSFQTKLLTGDQSMDEVGATIERIETEGQETGDLRLDVVVATNLISHGVDLERINMMTVCGMPSHYAEYVQASSRCARSHPGLVAVCFRASDPREISQFEFFPVMHEHMDRLIEAVAVNRFASFAPQKTVPGILAGLLLCQWTPELYGTQVSRPLDHVPTLNVALGNKPGGKTGTQSGCIAPDALRSAIHRIIGVDSVRPPASPAQVENVRRRVDDVFDDLMAAIGRSLETQLRDVLKPITSFRDVDEGIDFGSVDSADYAVRLRSR